jgi:hypothetical protein
MPVIGPLRFCPKFVAVEAFVADEQQWDALCFEEFHDERTFIGLFGDHFQMHRLAVPTIDGRQFGILAPLVLPMARPSASLRGLAAH